MAPAHAAYISNKFCLRAISYGSWNITCPSDARSKRRAIAIFEPFERTLEMALLLGIVGPPGMMFRTHKIGPLTWPRYVVSYVLPIAPLIATWDGVVSTLRAYTVEELRELAVAAGSSGYAWEAGRVT